MNTFYMKSIELMKYANELYENSKFPIKPKSLKLEEYEPALIKLSYGNSLIRDSYFINFKKRLSYGGDVFIDFMFRGRGFGKKLIQIREEINQFAGTNIILINLNINDNFWEHMNYKKSSFEEQERFRDILERKIVISPNMRYKRLD